MGPGDRKWISAKSVKPAAKVGVALGNAVDGMGVSVGRDVLVDVIAGVNASAVAKAACPVNATVVGRWSGGKGVGADSNDCEQADNSVRRKARRRIFFFMNDWNQCPAGLIESIN